MDDEPSIHDNKIYAYAVDCENRRITLHTEFEAGESSELIDVVFSDVLAHRFDHVLPGNILFDVQEVDAAELIRSNGSVFESSWRYGWPPVEYGGDVEALIAAVRQRGTRAFSIDSSYGLSGWVLAGRCDRLRRRERAQIGPDERLLQGEGEAQ